jgi:gliding motility-associated lipoprotein GldH
MIRFPVLALVFLTLLLQACGPDDVINQSADIKNLQWFYADSLQFEANIADTTQLYDIRLKVTHQPDFSWQNLYVRVNTIFPNGQRIQQPLSVNLADQGGVWFGQCNRKTCSLDMPIQENAYFQQTGTYTFVIEQFMRENPVKGIHRIGLQIKPTGSTRPTEQ